MFRVFVSDSSLQKGVYNGACCRAIVAEAQFPKHSIAVSKAQMQKNSFEADVDHFFKGHQAPSGVCDAAALQPIACAADPIQLSAHPVYFLLSQQYTWEVGIR